MIRYEAYLSREHWLTEIEHLESKGEKYFTCVVKPVTVKSKLSVEVT